MLVYIKIDDKGKVIEGNSNFLEGSIELDVGKDILLNINKYIYKNGELILDENYVEPPRPKTQLQILQEENEELKRRQQATQEALDYILMSVGGGV